MENTTSPLHRRRPSIALRPNAWSSPPGSFVMSSAAGNPIRLAGASSRSSKPRLIDNTQATTPNEQSSELVVDPEASGAGPPSPTAAPKSRFRSSLQKQPEDLSPEDRGDLSQHRMTRNFATKFFSRSKIDEEKIPLMQNIRPHTNPEFDQDDSGNESELSESYNNINLNPTIEKPKEEKPKTAKAHVLRKFLPRSKTLASVIRPNKAGTSKDSLMTLMDKIDNFEFQPLPLQNDRPNIRFEKAPAPAGDEPERMIPKVVVDPDVAREMTDAEIESLLDAMLPSHAAEFIADQERLHENEFHEQEHAKDEVLGYRSKSYVGCLHERPKNMPLENRGAKLFNGENPPPDKEAGYCPFCEAEDARKQAEEREDEEERKLLERTELQDVLNSQQPGPSIGKSTQKVPKVNVELVADASVIEEPHAPPTTENGKIKSGPGILYALRQGYTTNNYPRSAPSFGCIFTVCIPTDRVEAAISRHGRPLIAKSVAFNKYTVVISYHQIAGMHLAVIDVSDFNMYPLGFSSDQLVDLVYLQKGGYLPPHAIWPYMESRENEYFLTDQWSFCQAMPSGDDILYASSADVMVQRVVGCMFRLATTPNMSFVERMTHFEELSDDFNEEVNVTLNVRAHTWRQDRLSAVIPINFRRNAEYDWHLPTTELVGFGHSRNVHPVGQET